MQGVATSLAGRISLESWTLEQGLSIDCVLLPLVVGFGSGLVEIYVDSLITIARGGVIPLL